MSKFTNKATWFWKNGRTNLFKSSARMKRHPWKLSSTRKKKMKKWKRESEKSWKRTMRNGLRKNAESMSRRPKFHQSAHKRCKRHWNQHSARRFRPSRTVSVNGGRQENSTDQWLRRRTINERRKSWESMKTWLQGTGASRRWMRRCWAWSKERTRWQQITFDWMVFFGWILYFAAMFTYINLRFKKWYDCEE